MYLLERELPRAEVRHLPQPLRVLVRALQEPTPELPVPLLQPRQLRGVLLFDRFNPPPCLFLAHAGAHLGDDAGGVFGVGIVGRAFG